ncbi:hypothetical protein B7P43_G11203 [Cryptotermes secundus]|uniref:Uncharacterized protein n=1 Tax=Cryptotermes secundus TaxID=105785 RepID=A0A2J7QMA5_9NEOP|nr:hypothetical protein B7P43_G11203 [Cryptotermes secundus]
MIRSKDLRELRERGRGAFNLKKLEFTGTILVILTARDRNFDEFKSGGLHEKHAVATWNLGTISANSSSVVAAIT